MSATLTQISRQVSRARLEPIKKDNFLAIFIKKIQKMHRHFGKKHYNRKSSMHLLA
jgi:hypothetical protein